MNWASLPRRLQVFILGLIASAIPITLVAWWQLFTSPPATNDWIFLAILAVFTVLFSLLLPSVNTFVLIGDAYTIAIAMLYGPAPCIIATLCHTITATLLAAIRSRIYPHKVAFNSASTVCGAWLYSNIYLLLNPTLSREISDFVVPALALTVVFFTFNSLITATAISWATSEKIKDFWARNYLPMAIDFSISSVSASFIVALHQIGRIAPLAAAPFIGLVWGWNNVNRQKRIEAERHLKEQELLYLRTVESLALAVDAKDQVTYGHIRRVRAYAMGLTRLCGITDSQELMAIETGSLLHDIGKLAVEDYILNKPGPLSRQEFEKMKVHTAAGDEILRQIQFPFPVARYVRFHHERWNGSGYPDGLRGEEIPLGARILAVADAFDAMRSSRPYKLSIDLQDVIARLKADAGILYDPRLVDLFAEHIEELEAAASEAARNISEFSLRRYFEKLDLHEPLGESPFLTSKALQSSAGELIQLSEFCAGSGKLLDLKEILQILAQRIRRLVPYESCVIFLDSGDNKLKPGFVVGSLADSLNELSIDFGKGISGWTAAYRQPMLNADPALEFQGVYAESSRLVDALIVPLVTNDVCVGTISLYSESPSIYTPTHQEILQTISSMASQLIAEACQPIGAGPESEQLDPITRSHSAAYLSVVGPRLISVARQNTSPLCLASLDIKNLRQILNCFGRSAADLMISRVADEFRAELRETDVLVRFSGNGFVAILPGMRRDQGSRWAQRLQQRIRGITASPGVGQGITASCVVAVASYPQDGSDIYGLIGSTRHSIEAQLRVWNIPSSEASTSVVGFTPRD